MKKLVNNISSSRTKTKAQTAIEKEIKETNNKEKLQKYHGIALRIVAYMVLPICWAMLLVGPFLQ